MWYHSSVKWKVNLYVQIWQAWASSRPQTVLSYIEENPLFMDSVHWLHELVWIQAFFVFTEANEKSDTITSCIKWILNKKNWVKRMLQIFHYTTAMAMSIAMSLPLVSTMHQVFASRFTHEFYVCGSCRFTEWQLAHALFHCLDF